MRILILLLGLINGLYMLIDGIYVIMKGKYIGPPKPGPWAELFYKLDVNVFKLGPMFIGFGIVWLAWCYGLWTSQGWAYALGILISALTLWYLPVGTLFFTDDSLHADFCKSKNWTAIGLSVATPIFTFKQTNMKTATLKPGVELEIIASTGSSEHDFDFLQGKWKVHNRKLKDRLNNSNEWIEFDSELHMRKVLTGLGNVENYYASFDSKPFEGMAVRLFNPQTRLWKIYWIDSNNPVVDECVTGSFENKVGEFYARDRFKGQPILVLYKWDANDPEHPIWSQAFSTDDGESWEWNWEMVLTRL